MISRVALCLCCLLLLSATAFADDDGANPQIQSMTQLRQEYMGALQQAKKVYTKQTKPNLPFPSVAGLSSNNNSDNSTAKTQKKPAPEKTCNCYDNTNPYNYPDNFLYTANHIRVKRLDPVCKCTQQQVGDTTPIVTAATASTTNSTDDNDDDSSNSSSSYSAGAQAGSVIASPSSSSSSNSNNNSSSSSAENNNQNFGITY